MNPQPMTPEAVAALAARLARLDSASLSDAYDSLDLPDSRAGCGLAGIQARVPGQVVAGPAYTVQYRGFERASGEFHNAGNYIDSVPPGCVILIDNEGRGDCTNWGGILTTVARAKGVAGTVIHGAARDLAEVREQGYPLFTTAVNMVSGKNRVKVTGLQVPVTVGAVTVQPGDWLVGDDNGVLAIPAGRVEEVLERAEAIDRTESRILRAVREGMPLVEARKRWRYDKPWEEEGRG